MIARTFPSPERAAVTALALATAPQFAGVSGGYFRFSRLRSPTTRAGEGERLWRMTAATLGVDV